MNVPLKGFSLFTSISPGAHATAHGSQRLKCLVVFFHILLEHFLHRTSSRNDLKWEVSIAKKTLASTKMDLWNGLNLGITFSLQIPSSALDQFHCNKTAAQLVDDLILIRKFCGSNPVQDNSCQLSDVLYKNNNEKEAGYGPNFVK